MEVNETCPYVQSGHKKKRPAEERLVVNRSCEEKTASEKDVENESPEQERKDESPEQTSNRATISLTGAVPVAHYCGLLLNSLYSLHSTVHYLLVGEDNPGQLDSKDKLMPKPGPKKKLNMVRKWWRMHQITENQIDELLIACKEQLPLMADKMDGPLLIAGLVAKETRRLEEGVFDANELTECFKIEDEFEDEEAEETAAR